MKLTSNHPALSEARTIHIKRVRSPADNKSPIFKSVADNDKLGKGSNIIVKGKWRGFPMFSLTLQERATCPPYCAHWSDCYGNNMAFGHRFEHGPELETRIKAEIAAMAKRYPSGFVIRLHILGDFYSVGYVDLWKSLLDENSSLHLFGYTGHGPSSPIGFRLVRVMLDHRNRCWIRYSGARPTGHNLLSALSNPSEDSFTCPEMTGKTESCLTCGLCWSIKRPVYFPGH